MTSVIQTTSRMRGQRRDERPADDQEAAAGGPVAVGREREIGAAGGGIDDHQREAEQQVAAEQPAAAVDEPLQRELRAAETGLVGQRLALDRARGGLGGQQHVHRAALDQKHQHRSAEQHDAERGHERDKRHRLGHQRAGNRREHLAQAAAQQLREIAAHQGGDQDRGADDRHRQQDLEGRLRDELDGDDWPVGCGEKRAAFEQELEVQVAY